MAGAIPQARSPLLLALPADTLRQRADVRRAKFEVAAALASTMGVLTSLLGAVAAVSLLAGGIGIKNIMLVMRQLAHPRDRPAPGGGRAGAGSAAAQFLIEAVVLSALGGIIGILIATAASYVLSGVMAVPYAFDPSINLLALLFSAFIGVVFGYFPARRAARMDPI